MGWRDQSCRKWVVMMSSSKTCRSGGVGVGLQKLFMYKMVQIAPGHRHLEIQLPEVQWTCSILIPCFWFGRTFFQDHQKHGKHFTFGMILVWGSLGACSDRGSFTYVENLCVQIIVRKHRFWPIIRVEKACFLPLFLLLLDKLASYKKILLVDLCC